MDAVQRRVLAAATSSTISTATSSAADSPADRARLAPPPPEKPPAPLFDLRPAAGRAKLNAARLQNQMFAYTVTNQALNAFTELALPFLSRFVARFLARRRRGIGGAGGTPAKKKRVGFEDAAMGAAGAAAQGQRAKAERAFLERVRREVALPEYGLFEDYGEMVTQFGYVALWSTIWPLAPGECWFSLVSVFFFGIWDWLGYGCRGFGVFCSVFFGAGEGRGAGGER